MLVRELLEGARRCIELRLRAGPWSSARPADERAWSVFPALRGARRAGWRSPHYVLVQGSLIADARRPARVASAMVRAPGSSVPGPAGLPPQSSAFTNFARLIRHHEERDHVHDDPGDRQTRSWTALLHELSGDRGRAHPRSVTARLADPARRGRPVEGFETVEARRQPMLSLDNAASDEDVLRAFDERDSEGRSGLAIGPARLRGGD